MYVAFIALADLYMRRKLRTAMSDLRLAAFISAQVTARAALDHASGRSGSGFGAMPVRAFAFVVSNRYGTALTRQDAVSLVMIAFAFQLGLLIAQLDVSVWSEKEWIQAIGYCVAAAALVGGAVLQLLSSRRTYRIDHWLLRWLFLYLQSILNSTSALLKKSAAGQDMLQFYVNALVFSLSKSTQNLAGQKVLDLLEATPLARTSPAFQSATFIAAELALLPKLLESIGVDAALGDIIGQISRGVTKQLQKLLAAIKSKTTYGASHQSAVPPLVAASPESGH
jgi:hypothetical protein